ncbi:hypothetical protein [Staphylococcus epidermidis]|uniref:hypothetical protein n=1 Tax=Staphylococcus epidermidis TaxID=1282 RepID=UPI0007362EE4|nr:hypothetical protein [Staphylococcus epidermidis]KTT62006.1 hypothetical protein SB7C_02580 [Staphylococcus epidermidis]KTT79220.1 hypothetical protein SA6_10660 [Staphylococcus epidermidis]KTW08296.1 hypothetical protein SB7B_00950 [Staphylococcus epidermidis]
MNISKGFVKAIWFIICVILVIMLGNNYKFVEMFLMVTLGIIGFILIENFYALCIGIVLLETFLPVFWLYTFIT